jgi:biotin carboxyl carrier protein
MPWRARKAVPSIEELHDLVRIMDENLLTEVTVQEKGRKLAVKRAPAGPVERGGATEAGEPPTGGSDGLVAITSPAVGIFYSLLEPGAAPFVSEGQLVEPDQVIALIETLKVMSEVRSRIFGRVMSIEVGDGDMVEYGQTLMLCEEMDQRGAV